MGIKLFRIVLAGCFAVYPYHVCRAQAIVTQGTGATEITLGAHASNPEVGTFVCWMMMNNVVTALAPNRAIFEQRDVSTGAGYLRAGGDTGSTARRFGVMLNYTTKDSAAFMDTSATGYNWVTNTPYYLAWTVDAQSVAPRIFFGTMTTRAAEVTYSATPTARATGTGARVNDGGATAYLGQSAYQHAIDARGSWPGRIAFFAWYDTVLTDKQIIAHQFQTWNWLGTARQMLIPGWHGLSGCPDMSGNKRNGTLGANCTLGGGLPIGRRGL